MRTQRTLTDDERQILDRVAVALEFADMILAPTAPTRSMAEAEQPLVETGPIGAANDFVGFAKLSVGTALNDGKLYLPVAIRSGLPDVIAAEKSSSRTDGREADSRRARQLTKCGTLDISRAPRYDNLLPHHRRQLRTILNRLRNTRFARTAGRCRSGIDTAHLWLAI